MPNVFLDPFHRSLALQLEEEIKTLTERLVKGSASTVPEDTSSVAEKYASQIARIQAFNDVLELCKEIEKGVIQSGTRPAKVTVVER